MSRKPVLPNVRRFFDARECGQGRCGGDSGCDAVRAELRAAEAVIRAARRAAKQAPFCPCPGCWGAKRALARLDRTTGRATGREGR